MKEKIIITTDGLLLTEYAKTAHGLIRGSDRYDVLAIIDEKYKGLDIGRAIKQSLSSIPVLGSIEEAIHQFNEIDFLVIGVATVGGVLPETLKGLIKKALSAGIGVVNGLHELLKDHEDFVKLANEKGVELIDIRAPKPIKELHFWKGDIYSVDVPVVAFLALDCAMGKRTTAKIVKNAFRKQGKKAEMIYTGQTGWLEGNKYGFILDSTINDFVSGELENAIVSCWKNEQPDVILIEGQSSLRNPSGPCGSELLLSGNAKQVVLVHAPHRKYFDDEMLWGLIPSVESEIEIIERYGSKVVALALNTSGLLEDEIKYFKSKYKELLDIPVVIPFEEGVDAIIEAIEL